MEVRPCRRDEVAAVVGLLGKGAPSVESLAAKRTADPWSVLVATEDGRIVGTATFIHDPLYSFVFNLEVRKDRRRHGFGEALVREAMRLLALRGTSEIGAYVVWDNAASKALFRKLGWREYGSCLVAFGHKPEGNDGP